MEYFFENPRRRRVSFKEVSLGKGKARNRLKKVKIV